MHPLLCLNRSASHCMAILTRMTLTSSSRVPSQFLALLFLLRAGEHRGKNTQPLSTTYHNNMQRFERILTTTLHGWGNVQRRLGLYNSFLKCKCNYIISYTFTNTICLEVQPKDRGKGCQQQRSCYHMFSVHFLPHGHQPPLQSLQVVLPQEQTWANLASKSL